MNAYPWVLKLLLPKNGDLHATGGANCIYGWLVGHRHRLQSPQPLPDMTRIKRSLFEMLTAPTELD